MKRPRILLDVDGVLGNFTGPYIEHVNQVLGTAYTVDDITEFDIGRCLGLSDEAIIQCYDAIPPGWCRGLPVSPEAIDGVAQLRELGQVYIVTSPLYHPTWAHERAEWLWKHFKIPFNKIVSTSAKYTVSGDYLIDDRMANLSHWELEQKGVGVHWKNRHNRGEVWTGRSAYHWPGVLAHIKEGR